MPVLCTLYIQSQYSYTYENNAVEELEPGRRKSDIYLDPKFGQSWKTFLGQCSFSYEFGRFLGQ